VNARLAAAMTELVEALREEIRTGAEADSQLPDRLLSISDAARELAIGRTLTYSLIGKRQLRTVRAGRRVLVPISAIREYIATAPDERAGDQSR
jgi:excisionase family DNA binding protein